MNNIITASRLNSLIHCPRSHFWAYEVGLAKESAGIALRFGSAWHRAMEARWKGANYGDALALAIPEGIDLDEYSCSTLAALLAGYYDHYGPKENIGQSEPEQEFALDISDTHFTMQGKIDNIGAMNNGSYALVEAKTTSDSVYSDSDYWLRLRFNLQVFQYLDASRKMGYDISKVYYDVVRKPMIKPLKSVPALDDNGRKIVLDKNGDRVFAKKKIKETVGKGKKAKVVECEVNNLDRPKQSAGPDEVLKCAPESPDQYCDRLWKDCADRPEFYFCRKEIPIIEAEFQQFERQRLAMIKVISHYRSQETTDVNLGDRDPEAWPRNVSTHTCNFCAYKSFCLQNITIDLENLPPGYSIKQFNPELSYAPTEETNSAA